MKCNSLEEESFDMGLIFEPTGKTYFYSKR